MNTVIHENRRGGGGIAYRFHAEAADDPFRRLACLAADLLPGAVLYFQDRRHELREPGWINGHPGWWFTDGGFMTFANMLAFGARAERKR